MRELVRGTRNQESSFKILIKWHRFKVQLFYPRPLGENRKIGQGKASFQSFIKLVNQMIYFAKFDE